MDSLRFIELCTPVAELVERKSKDYQTGPVKHDEYFVFGHKSFVQMLRTKVLRLTSLVSETGVTPNFEGIDDSVQDLLAYTVFYLDWLDRQPKALPPAPIPEEPRTPYVSLSKPWSDPNVKV